MVSSDWREGTASTHSYPVTCATLLGEKHGIIVAELL